MPVTVCLSVSLSLDLTISLSLSRYPYVLNTKDLSLYDVVTDEICV